MNPALTVRDIVFGYIAPKLGLLLCLAQTMGAFAASFSLHMLYKEGYNSDINLNKTISEVVLYHSSFENFTTFLG